MKEYCLLTSTGAIVNMCMSSLLHPPELTDFQFSRGYKWVHVSEVPQSVLRQYEHWNESP